MDGDIKDRAVALVEALGLGRAAEVTAVVPLTGGVASDIARVDVGGRSYAVKFALGRLRVAAEWLAPVHRSRAEYAWLEVAGQVAPEAVPVLHGYDAGLGGFAMEYLGAARQWKAALLAGAAAGPVAAAVADVLGRIHAAGAQPGFDRTLFGNATDFHALRVEPYLLYTAGRHPGVAGRLRALADGLDRAAVTLVHGDVSPKNILVRDGGPVLLDAECATMGDPAFDVAFCLNHLVLKSVHLPGSREELRRAALGFWAAYAGHVDWEDAGGLEARVAGLLPALMLARVDGKSPVEYLSSAGQAVVRAVALGLLEAPVAGLGDVMGRMERA
jgi:aminoglycoside phosphotransferase (APT) family kinase protein